MLGMGGGGGGRRCITRERRFQLNQEIAFNSSFLSRWGSSMRHSSPSLFFYTFLACSTRTSINGVFYVIFMFCPDIRNFIFLSARKLALNIIFLSKIHQKRASNNTKVTFSPVCKCPVPIQALILQKTRSQKSQAWPL